MSYRTLKRLLGETSLERKCRLLLGGGFLVLILLGFVLVAWQTENLIWDQNVRTGRLLVNRVVRERHMQALAGGRDASSKDDQQAALRRFLAEQTATDVTDAENYVSRLLRPNISPERRPAEYSPAGSDLAADAVKRLYEEGRKEMSLFDDAPDVFTYLRAIHADARCLDCHPTTFEKTKLGVAEYKPGAFMAAVSVQFPLETTELTINVNRSILLSFALVTAILAMVFAYIIVRYVIVKPVTHLKEVSEEIAAGNLTIRSEIATGDEFEELSHAFNRMLRSLVQMQDELRRVNADLDGRLDDLANANLSLFEMNRLKSEFLATISHELRTPLNAILGFGDLLAESESANDKRKRWIANIQSSGKVLLGLINDILDLAKLEAGKMQVSVEEFSLRDLIEVQLGMVRPLADQKSIRLSSDVDATLPILKQDSKKIAQIVNNLLSNAIKFTPEGGQVSVSARKDRAHFLLSVRDNGIGIAPEDQRLIFEKFRQTGSTLTRQHGGTGLGLSIVRELTKLLGGDDVQLESQLGRGSTFTIRLPIQYAEPVADELSLGRSGIHLEAELKNQAARYYSSRESSPAG